GLDRLGRHAQSSRAFPVQPLAPREHSFVAPLAHVGDDLGGSRQRVRDVGSGHGTSLSTGRTRMEDAPAAFSGGSRSHTWSTSMAAWTAIWPGSASSSTDGAPMLGRTARISSSAAAGALIIT